MPCKHGKQPCRCRLCNGMNVCRHVLDKKRCTICSPETAACAHGCVKRKNGCKLCRLEKQGPKPAKQLCDRSCKHTNRRDNCFLCSPQYFCVHEKLRWKCKHCSGARNYCEHDRLRYRCQVCSGPGAGRCLHGKFKQSCPECGCTCATASCGIIVKKQGDFCKTCKPTPAKNSRCAELRIASLLQGWDIPACTFSNQLNPSTVRSVCGSFRPDFVWDMQFFAIVLEVDEIQHKYYDRNCELVRMSRIVEGFGGVPVHIIRFNPDAFKINGRTRRMPAAERHLLLQTILIDALQQPDLENQVTVRYMCFDQDQVDEFVSVRKFRTLEDFDQWVTEVSGGV